MRQRAGAPMGQQKARQHEPDELRWMPGFPLPTAIVIVALLLVGGDIVQAEDETEPSGRSAEYLDRTAEAWEEALIGNDAAARREWGRLVRGKGRAVRILEVLLSSEDALVRKAALEAVLLLGECAASTARAVFRGIQNGQLCFGADAGGLSIQALDRMGGASSDLLFELFLRNSSWAMRWAAGNALARRGGFLGTRRKELRSMLFDSEDEDLRVWAAGFLRLSGAGGIKVLDEALYAPDDEMLLIVLESLARSERGDGVGRLFETVLSLATTRKDAVKCAAVHVLPHVGQDRSVTATFLRGLLQDEDPALRMEAVHALLRLGEGEWEQGEPEGTIIQALGDERYGMRLAAAEASLLLEGGGADIVKALIAVSPGSSPGLRSATYAAIEKLGPDSSVETDALAFLRKAFESKEEMWAVGRAIVSFKARGASLLADMLKNHMSPVARRLAAKLLGEMGRDALDAAALLRSTLEADDPLLRICAALSLWRVTGEPASSLRILIQEATSLRPVIRCNALKGLIKMGRVAAPAIPQLTRLIEEDPHSDAAWLSLLVAAQSEPPHSESARKVIEILQDEPLFLRTARLNEVEEIGMSLAPLHAVLLSTLDNADWRQREWSAKVLQRIGVPNPVVILRLERAAEEDPDLDVRYAAAAALLSLRN